MWLELAAPTFVEAVSIAFRKVRCCASRLVGSVSSCMCVLLDLTVALFTFASCILDHFCITPLVRGDFDGRLPEALAKQSLVT